MDYTELLPASGREVPAAAIVLDEHGDGFALWAEDGTYVKARRFADGAWAAAADDLTQVPANIVSSSWLMPAMSADGSAVVAWTSITPSSGGRIESARWVDGAWSAIPEVTPRHPSGTWLSNVAVGADGGTEDRAQRGVAEVDVAAQRQRLGKSLDEAVARVLGHCQFINGPEVTALEDAQDAAFGLATCIDRRFGELVLQRALAGHPEPGGPQVLPRGLSSSQPLKPSVDQRCDPVRDT